MSTARSIVLGVLLAADMPVTADEIAATLTGGVPSVDRASIYRNLEMLEQQGLAYHVHLGHGPRRFRLVNEAATCYVVCERCDRVKTVDSADLDDARDAVAARLGYRASFEHFPVVGICPECIADG
jgi:Fur family ferric uptake transcriptional regulator